MPGKIIKGKVDSVVWARARGSCSRAARIPMSGVHGACRRAASRSSSTSPSATRQLFLAAGAAGDAAIYTDHLHAVHIIRKVILRVGSYLNYLILKLH